MPFAIKLSYHGSEEVHIVQRTPTRDNDEQLSRVHATVRLFSRPTNCPRERVRTRNPQ